MVSTRKNILILLPVLLLAQWSYGQFTIPKKPKKQTSVYDYAGLLDKREEQQLEKKLLTYADTTSTQIVIATIESLQGENIGLLTPRWGHAWAVGQAEEDNGVFILLAEQERKIWISPGYGAEERLTAGINGTIIRNVIVPEFKRGDYYAGLDKGTSAIMEVLAGAYTNDTDDDGSGSGLSLGVVVLLVVIFIIIIISSIKNNRGGGRRRRRGLDLTDILILSSLGKGGFGSGSSSGGGSFGGGFSGGFGGGGFSGGGAGGSW